MTRMSAMLRAAACAAFLSFSPAHGQPPASALFVLGDSLSDVGNAAAAADFALGMLGMDRAIGLCNPADVLLARSCDDLLFRASRVSDGPVAVEHLAAHLGLPELTPSRHVVLDRQARGTNYAVASAKAGGAELEDLRRQTDMLVLDHGPLLPRDALFAVIIGGNDALDALQAALRGSPPPRDAETAIASAVHAIGETVGRLIDHGARRVIVANVPDLALLPAVRAAAQRSSDPAATLSGASAISRELNARIGIALDAALLGRPDAQVLRFDLGAALARALEDAAAAGHNVRDACFDSLAYRASPMAERVFHADCAPDAAGARFGEFAFWDLLHPTGALHAALGRALSELYDQSF